MRCGVPSWKGGGSVTILWSRFGVRSRGKDRIRGSGSWRWRLSPVSRTCSPTVALPQIGCVSHQANRTLSCLSWPSLRWAWLCGMGRPVDLRDTSGQ